MNFVAHTLASVLYRVIKSITAIKVLAEKELIDQAFVQIRALYELYLNFFIDWLSPEKIGPYLQFFDVCSKKDWKKYKSDMLENAAKEGWSKEDTRLQKKSDNIMGELMGKVSEKASLNPLYPKHRELYAFLSGYTHQDFYTTAQYIDLLDNKLFIEDIAKKIVYIRTYTDLIVAGIIGNISSEIGEPNQPFHSDGNSAALRSHR